MKLLLIEDDRDIIDAVILVFRLRWPEVSVLTTIYGEKGIQLTREESPNLVILDLGLSDIDGFQVLSGIRAFTDIPVIILSARGDEISKIRGLELGADDYITKPFSPGEFLARVKMVIRRSGSAETKSEHAPNSIAYGKLHVDINSNKITIDGQSLKLSPRAYDLLAQLAKNEGEFVPTEMLMKVVFLPEEKPGEDLIIFLVKNINEKLGQVTGIQQSIVGEPSKGYKLQLY